MRISVQADPERPFSTHCGPWRQSSFAKGMTSLRFLLTLLLPYRRIDEEQALAALRACGFAPDDLAWRVTENGALAFGRNSAEADPLPEMKVRRLTEWASKRRAQLTFIGWETTADWGSLSTHCGR
jgi:hypothetical protein